MEIVKESLSEQIYSVLKAEILAGNITFGDILSNRSMQERFQVSSSPVRDAINHLLQDGLVERVTKAGARVITPTEEFYVEVNEILTMIQTTAVKLAHKKSDCKEVVRALREILPKQEENIGNEAYFQYDYEFHKVFVTYSGNERLKDLFKVYNVLHEVLVRHIYLKAFEENQRECILRHREIVDAFERGDVQLAIDLMEGHYRGVEHIFRNAE